MPASASQPANQSAYWQPRAPSMPVSFRNSKQITWQWCSAYSMVWCCFYCLWCYCNRICWHCSSSFYATAAHWTFSASIQYAECVRTIEIEREDYKHDVSYRNWAIFLFLLFNLVVSRLNRFVSIAIDRIDQIDWFGTKGGQARTLLWLLWSISIWSICVCDQIRLTKETQLHFARDGSLQPRCFRSSWSRVPLSLYVYVFIVGPICRNKAYIFVVVCVFVCVSRSRLRIFILFILLLLLLLLLPRHHWLRSFRKNIRDFHNRIASTNTAETKTIFYSLFFFLLFVCLFGGLIGGAVITVHETIINDQRILCLLSVNRIERRRSISSCVISLFYFVVFFT